MTRTVLEYFPPGGGDSILWTTGDAARYRLLTLDGIEAVKVDPQDIKSPGQTGVTAVDVIVPPRVVVVQSLLQGLSTEDLWDLRAALNRAMVVQPVRLGADIELGRLRLTLPDRQALEIECLPTSVKAPRPAGRNTLGVADVELYAPYPYWREIADSRLTFTTEGGGFEFGLEFSLEMTSNNVEQELINEGDVDAPPLMRIYGECDTVRMLNETTGETIEITGTIDADQYVEIETAFGAKAVTLVDGGVRTSIMDRLNLDLPDFWTLRPGVNLIKFEADTNVSGHAELFWRERYSGV